MPREISKRCWGAYASSRVVFGVSPNIVFRRDAGKLHAGTRALPKPLDAANQ